MPRAHTPTPDPEALRDQLRADLMAACPVDAAFLAEFELAVTRRPLTFKSGVRIARGAPVLYHPAQIRLEEFASIEAGAPRFMATIRVVADPRYNLGVWWHELESRTGTPVLPTESEIIAALARTQADRAMRDQAGLPAHLSVSSDARHERYTITDTRTGRSATLQQWEFASVKRVLIALGT